MFFILFADLFKDYGGTTAGLHTPNIQLCIGQLRLPKVLCFVNPSQLGEWICLYKQKLLNYLFYKSDAPERGGEIFIG